MEDLMKELIVAINGLAVSVDELTTELADVKESINDLNETVKTTDFAN